MLHVVIIGAGHRGDIYASFADFHEHRMSIVGVVEPDAVKRDAFARRYGIAPQRAFDCFEDFARCEPLADAVIICSPDNLHYSQTMTCIARGYHVLLEKPIASTIAQCEEILRASASAARVVGVCYPLRYYPLYERAKELITGGDIGPVVQISHTEYVGIDRMTHNFVRGPWNREDTSSPILLSKTCHDMDLVVWLADSSCRTLHSSGSLKWFRAENRPAAAGDRCTDCVLEATCAYSAIDLYCRRKGWLRHFNDLSSTAIRDTLRTNCYGRCVFGCDNTVFDNQALAMEMENGVSVSFSLNTLTLNSGRSTHIMGGLGEIHIDTSSMVLSWSRFQGRETQREDFSHTPKALHAGADWRIVDDFLAAIETGDDLNFRVSIRNAIDSHRIALWDSAER